MSTRKDDPWNRLDGTDSLTDIYKQDTPGQSPEKKEKVVKLSLKEFIEKGESEGCET